MKHIFLLGALFLFGATASAQSCTGSADKKAKTECKKGKASCCSGKAAASMDSKCKESNASRAENPAKLKGKKMDLNRKDKGKSKEKMAMTPSIQKADKKARMSPAKD